MGKGNGHATREVEERTLAVRLTESELLERGEKMADAEIAIAAYKEKRAAIGRDITAESKRRAELADVIESGTEERVVRCEWAADFPKNVWRLMRQDTYVQVDTRPMTAADRQGSLGLDADAGHPRSLDVIIDDLHVAFDPPSGVSEAEVVDPDTGEVTTPKRGPRLRTRKPANDVTLKPSGPRMRTKKPAELAPAASMKSKRSKKNSQVHA